MQEFVTVIGIDGGGSNTRAAIVDQDGRVIGFGASGSSNYDDVGVNAAAQSIAAAVSNAWRAAEIEPRTVDAAFLGMAGVRSDRDANSILDMSTGLNLAPLERVGVDHDVRTALAGGLAGEPGIAIIAGTGSSCYGRNDQGESWMAGGWSILDDLGSSWFLGIQGMIAAVQAYDGRGQATRLINDVRSALAIDDLNEILHRIHVAGLSRSEIAGLAPMVVDAAKAGDSVAHSILERGAFELARLVETVTMKISFPKDVAITTIGGLVNGSEYYRELVASGLKRRLPDCRIMRPTLPPVLGAAILALNLADVNIGNSQIRQLANGASHWGMA